MVLQDRRVRRTQQLLSEALIELTLRKGYEAVTIRDITEQADIGYATFFRHYRDKDELLQDVLDAVLAELTGLLSSSVPDADPAAVGAVLFRYVESHIDLVRVLLGSRAVLARVITAASRLIVEDQPSIPHGRVPLEIGAHHIVSATVALIDWWLDHDMPYSPEHMGQIYRDLIAQPTVSLVFSE